MSDLDTMSGMSKDLWKGRHLCPRCDHLVADCLPECRQCGHYQGDWMDVLQPVREAFAELYKAEK